VRSLIYEIGFRPLTMQGYREVLNRQPRGGRFLDVGVATGGSLVRNGQILRERDLTVYGIDIDADYLRTCRKQVDAYGLGDRIEVEQRSVYDLAAQGFHGAYFGASFMLMPDPVAAARRVVAALSEDGRIFFTQTFQEVPSAFWERAKPLLHRVTTIHFGRVTYEPEFLATLDAAALDVVDTMVLRAGRDRTVRLFETRPRTLPSEGAAERFTDMR
jgi:hypothetical protein